MGKINVSADRTIGAPAQDVYSYIADHREHHPNFLPPQFSDFKIESGGVGAGTIVTFKTTAGGRTRDYRMQVEEPEPGRVMVERDANSSMVTTWTVTPEGEQSKVHLKTEWDGAGGVGGFFERTFAPRVMRKIYDDELGRLDEYARSQQSALAPPAG
jgi:Polyketide cyclase / dehydrase and lipid transport